MIILSVSTDLDTLLKEERVFQPSEEFRAQANFNDPEIYERAARDPEAYWAEEAKALTWFKPYERVLEWEAPHAKWFVGGKLNAAYNCVDRHREGVRKNKAAIIWASEAGDTKVYTYDMLGREVDKAAHMLNSLGVRKGDCVAVYMPMIPELAITLLACAKIGAIHTVVFGGFSAKSLRERIEDTKSKVLITADAGWRRGKHVPLKQSADEAVTNTTIEKVLVVENIGLSETGNTLTPGRDVLWHELKKEAPTTPFSAAEMDAEDILYLLYTSGTTGKPKGVVHTIGGYLVGANNSMRSVFDLKDTDVFWCTADIGWVTGHTYVVYGPLSAGATTVMFEGTPDYPGRDRFWELIEDLGVTVFYTAPTAIRTFMKWGAAPIEKHNLGSLRLIGSVGEPINPEAWMWYHKHIGKERCPIVDTWWQTETGCAIAAPLPGITATKPGSATRPLPGMAADVVDSEGNSVAPGRGGKLVIRKPWPSMLRTVWGNDARYQKSYFGDFGDIYVSGDGARKDEDGYIWVLGRLDDVVNVSGHRIGTMELESAIVGHDAVAEAAVIGRSDAVKGQAITAFVTLKEGIKGTDTVREAIREEVTAQIGKFARPEEILFIASLPKTRSAKIMRRLLRDIAEGRVLGDTTTLEDADVVEELKRSYTENEE